MALEGSAARQVQNARFVIAKNGRGISGVEVAATFIMVPEK